MRLLAFCGLLSVLALVNLGCSILYAAEEPRIDYRVPIVIPTPSDNQLTPERIELGKSLFFDPRLSSTNWISCASCHNPALGWGDGLPLGFGHGMKQLPRHVPTIINSAFFSTQFWDGRSDSLESQALGPMSAPGEMNQDLHALSGEIAKIDGYKSIFARAYPGEQVSPGTIAKAIASFERTIISRNSAFDRWRIGDETAINAEARRGFEVFNGKANCNACHSGFNFSDDGFHNIGVTGTDEGRFAVSKIKINQGAFKTPGLRDVSRTGPYMHNGMYRTLEEVVEHYDRGGDVKENLDPNMKPLNLTPQEKIDLVEFMKTLDGEPIQLIVPRLPQ